MKARLALCSAFVLALVLVCLSSSSVIAQTPGTAFVYQGLLTGEEGAVDDTCDFSFALFDAPTAGAAVGAPLSRANIVVTGGLFAVSLDFGGVFTGAPRWLQVTAQCSDDPAPVILLPRQELTPTPYAIFAASAGTAAQATNAATAATATTAVNATNATNAQNALNAEVATNAENAENAVSATFAMTATTASSVKWSGVQNKPNWQCPSGEALREVLGDGQQSCIALSAGEVDPLSWHLGGNSASAGQFLGTTNDVAVEVRVNNVTAQRYLFGADSDMDGESDTDVTPHVVGGSSTNVVNDGEEGAVIGGGIFANAGGSYNVIGGGFGNSTNGDASTVSGGRNNTAPGEGATVAGGSGNAAQNIYDAVGGGTGNEASGSTSTIGGGFENSATASQATVGGGRINTASGIASTVAGGWSNLASGNRAAIGGGESNQGSASHSTVAGGKSNMATGDFSFVGGGETNIASGKHSAIGGGRGNATVSERSTIPGGSYAKTTNLGQMAFASGGFLTNPNNPASAQIPGSAQTSVYVMRNRTTTTSVQAALSLDVGDVRPLIPNGSLVVLDGIVVGTEEGAGGIQRASYVIRAFVEGTGTGLVIHYVSIVPLIETDTGWDVSLTIDTTNFLTITVLGSGSANVRWVARIETTEVMK